MQQCLSLDLLGLALILTATIPQTQGECLITPSPCPAAPYDLQRFGAATTALCDSGALCGTLTSEVVKVGWRMPDLERSFCLQKSN